MRDMERVEMERQWSDSCSHLTDKMTKIAPRIGNGRVYADITHRSWGKLGHSITLHNVTTTFNNTTHHSWGKSRHTELRARNVTRPWSGYFEATVVVGSPGSPVALPPLTHHRRHRPDTAGTGADQYMKLSTASRKHAFVSPVTARTSKSEATPRWAQDSAAPPARRARGRASSVQHWPGRPRG